MWGNLELYVVCSLNSGMWQVSAMSCRKLFIFKNLIWVKNYHNGSEQFEKHVISKINVILFHWDYCLFCVTEYDF